MCSRRRRFFGATALFLAGGIGYNLLELLWRGYTHWSMTVLGGICFHLIGRIFMQTRCRLRSVCCVCSALAVTAAEFACGCLVNRLWHMQVWDYSGMPANLLGQVCLPYTLLWGLLSLPAAWLYRTLHRLLCGETQG